MLSALPTKPSRLSMRAFSGSALIASPPWRKSICGRWPIWDPAPIVPAISPMNSKGTVQSLGPIRAGLIAKGMIWSPTHGDTAFTVPLFDEFMKRIMPGNEWKAIGN